MSLSNLTSVVNGINITSQLEHTRTISGTFVLSSRTVLGMPNLALNPRLVPSEKQSRYHDYGASKQRHGMRDGAEHDAVEDERKDQLHIDHVHRDE